MGLAATPVDAELARPSRGASLLATITPVIDGDDYETPRVLGEGLDGDPIASGATRDRRVRWIDGYSFYPDDCYGGHIVDPCQLGSGADTSAADAGTSSYVGPIQPFVIEVSDVCSTFGASQAYRLDRAGRKLASMRSQVLEAEWWKGTKAIARSWTNNQYLANASGLTMPEGGNALGYLTALALLEQAVANGSSWQRGVIHCTPRVATHWISQQVVRAVPQPGVGASLMTEMGTLVVAGSGYDGSGPIAGLHSAHLQWAYVTGIPQIRLGAVTYNETDDDVVAVNRQTNDRTIRAQQFASIAITPCIRAAVLVDLSTAIHVSGS